MNTTTTDSDFQFPQSPSHHHLFASSSSSAAAAITHQNHRKKRSKLILINNTPTKPKYGKKPDPGAPKITRPCSECGKKFWSWKALFGHMRCHPERQWRGINPPPNFRQTVSPAKPLVSDQFEAVMSEQDQEVAASLLMLANGPSAMEVTCGASYQCVKESEAFFWDHAGTSSSCRFECSSCKKVFGSHQALGGHRASHKNVKGCFAITRSDSEVEEQNERECEGVVMKESGVDEKMVMVLGGNGHGHKCSICWRVFSSGQALGGHKRCHWEKGEESLVSQGLNPFVTKDHGCGLDLNLPAPMEDDSSSTTTSYSSGLTLDLRLGL